MAINYGPYLALLDAVGGVSIRIQAGVDPVVSCNIGLFAENPAPPPPFVAVQSPMWPALRTTSNVLPVIFEPIAPNGALLNRRRLMVIISLSVLAPDPNPATVYGAVVQVIQNNQLKGEVPVRLTNADLQSWHQYAIDFKV
jgi:hypothetical protein